jgi:transposase
VRTARLWKRLLGVESAVIEEVFLEGVGLETVFVARVHPQAKERSRCGRCKRRSPLYDRGDGPRRWRTLDLGHTKAYLEADVPRVTCSEHGVCSAAVPWARHGTRHTTSFEDMCAWLLAEAPATSVAELLRVTWRTTQAIVERVVADLAGRTELLDGLRRIGIDEMAHRRGQRYITCVVDHDTGRLVWAKEGRNAATLEQFFSDLGEERAAALTHVSADGAEWIHTVVEARAPQALICLDPFHVMAWVTKALDGVRRKLWRELQATGTGSEIKGARWALLKSPLELNEDQRISVAVIAKTNRPLYRAYLLKEQMRAAIAVKGAEGRALLGGWVAWAKRSQLPEFKEVANTIERFRPYIWNTMEQGLSNARSEATNTHLRVLTPRAYGFHSPQALIAMAMLTRGGLRPELPGRT